MSDSMLLSISLNFTSGLLLVILQKLQKMRRIKNNYLGTYFVKLCIRFSVNLLKFVHLKYSYTKLF